MIKLRTPEKEFYDEVTNTFTTIPGKTYKFEHSLISLSKWESITCRPFLSVDGGKLHDDDLYLYFECMCFDDTFSSSYLSSENIRELTTYVDSTHTATTIRTTDATGPRKVITSEVIYAMMVDAGVPFTCEKWNLNRLLTLINVISARRNPKKMSRQDIYKQNSELNKLRRHKYNTKG